jgi:hypothetical protein
MGKARYFSCTRCKIEGEFLKNRTCFPYNESDLQPSSRTHGEYLDGIKNIKRPFTIDIFF